jgi:hypothetical protein
MDLVARIQNLETTVQRLQKSCVERVKRREKIILRVTNDALDVQDQLDLIYNAAVHLDKSPSEVAK